MQTIKGKQILTTIEDEIERLFKLLSVKEVRRNYRLIKKTVLLKEKLNVLRQALTPKALNEEGAT